MNAAWCCCGGMAVIELAADPPTCPGRLAFALGLDAPPLALNWLPNGAAAVDCVCDPKAWPDAPPLPLPRNGAGCAASICPVCCSIWRCWTKGLVWGCAACCCGCPPICGCGGHMPPPVPPDALNCCCGVVFDAL